MMSYSLFIGLVQERIKEYLPIWLKDYEVKIDKQHKINHECDFLTLVPTKDMSSAFVCPAIPLSEVYRVFGEYQNMEDMLHYIADIIVSNSVQFNEQEIDFDLNNHMDKLVMNIINSEKNEELLKRVPHRDILDFSIIYRFILQKEGNGYGTVVLTHDIMEGIELSEEELFKLALVNTKRLFPVSIRNMGEMFFIITNKDNLQGASYMAHEDVLRELYEKVDGNYYIVPTSLHEFIAVGTKYISLPDARDMLERGLRDICDEGEFLSDKVYLYDGSKGMLRIT